jgi:uncharacterized membrane protein YfcA
MSALAGGGSGLVQLPALLLLGLPFPVALATHKTVTVALGLGAFVRIAKEKQMLDLKFAAFILACGILGTVLGVYIVVQLPETLAKTALGLLILGLSAYSWIKRDIGQTDAPRNRTIKGIMIGGALLFLFGVLNGSLAAGSGLFVTMTMILWFGMDYKRAVAYTMILVGIFWNAAGGLTLVTMGAPIYWPWIPVLLVGSFAGGYLGAHFGALKGNRVIKIAFVAVTLLSGLSLLFG